MKRTLTALRLGAGLFILCVSAVCMGQMTSPTAPTGSLKMAGITIANGSASFTAVDTANGNIPIPVRTGDNIYDLQAITCTITNGALSGCSVPDMSVAIALKAGAVPGYNITIYDASSKRSYTLQGVKGVQGTTWALNTYAPTQGVYSVTGISTGSTLPTVCHAPAIFYTQTSPPASYECVGSVFVQQTGSGGSGTSITSATATSLAAGSQPTASVNGGVLALGIPVGATGPAGPTGPSGTAGATGPAGPAPNCTGIVKSNGTVASCAVADTDYASTSSVQANSTAITNEATTARNASNLTSGTIPNARLGATINGKPVAGNPFLSRFDVGAVAGPIAGSSLYYTTTEQGGAYVDTVQGFIPYWIPVSSHSIQVVFGNTGAVAEATCGPTLTVRAALEYPVDTTPMPLYFNGARDATMAPCGMIISDPIEIDTTAASQIAEVRYRATRAPGESAPLLASWSAGFERGNNSVLAPYTTTKTSASWEGVEEIKTRSVADAVSNGTTTITSATAAFTANDAGQVVAISTGGTYASCSQTGAGVGTGTVFCATVGAYSNSTTITLSTAYTATSSGLTLSISAADKTTSGTIYVNGGGNVYSPVALLGAPAGTIKGVSLLGDSITWGQGGNSYYGSWAEQALNITAANAGLDTHVATAIPFINMSMPGETAANIAAATNHRFRMSMLTRTKYTLGMLGTNDIGAGASAATVEASLITVATNERSRGTLPWLGTIIPRVNSADYMLTVAGQTPMPTESVRVSVNTWLRDGAPMDCTTLAPLATGSATSTTERAAYWNAATRVSTATVGSGCPAGTVHPLDGVMELADSVETARNSGLWMVDPNVLTVPGCSIAAGSQSLTCTGGSFTSAFSGRTYSIPGAGASGQNDVGYITGYNSATNLTVGVAATTAVSNVSVLIDAAPQGGSNARNNSRTAGRYGEGTHPSTHGHYVIAQYAAQTIAAAWSW